MDPHYDTYDNGLSVVAEQLKNIQQTQDIVLAELTMDIEQLNTENLTLRLCNEKLNAENQHLRGIVNDLCKTTNILREHLNEAFPGESHHDADVNVKNLVPCYQQYHPEVSTNEKTDPQQQLDDDHRSSLCDALNDISSPSESGSVSTTTISKNSHAITDKKMLKGKQKQRKVDKETTRCFEFLRKRKEKDEQLENE